MDMRDQSKSQRITERVTIETINCGSLQRIADATEMMAKNYLALQSDLDWNRNRNKELSSRNSSLCRQVSALRGVITKLRKRTEFAWIDVNDEMPDSDLTVLVFTGGETWLGYFDGNVWQSVEAGAIEVTHWMELPEGPKDYVW